MQSFQKIELEALIHVPFFQVIISYQMLPSWFPSHVQWPFSWSVHNLSRRFNIYASNVWISLKDLVNFPPSIPRRFNQILYKQSDKWKMGERWIHPWINDVSAGCLATGKKISEFQVVIEPMTSVTAVWCSRQRAIRTSSGIRHLTVLFYFILFLTVSR